MQIEIIDPKKETDDVHRDYTATLPEASRCTPRGFGGDFSGQNTPEPEPQPNEPGEGK